MELPRSPVSDSVPVEIRAAEMTDVCWSEETLSEVLDRLDSLKVTGAQAGEGKCQTGTFPLRDGADADIHLSRLHLHT